MADINASCLAAANALQALGHLQPGFSSDISPRLTENQRRQSRNISEADVTQSTQLSQSGEAQQNISIQSRLQSCFPTIASRVGRNTVRDNGVSKRSKPRKSGTPGRPKKLLCTKIWLLFLDLILKKCQHTAVVSSWRRGNWFATSSHLTKNGMKQR